MPSYKQAVATAHTVITQLETQAELLRRHGHMEQAHHLLTGQPVTYPHGLNAEALHSVAQACAVSLLWQRHRTVYSADAHLVNELAASTASTLPGDVFHRLPHINPLVTFPEPLSTTLPDGAPGSILGYYVYGVYQPRTGGGNACYVHTHNSRMNRLGLMTVTAVHDGYGNADDYDITRVTVPLNDTFDIDTAVDASVRLFYRDTPMSTEALVGWLKRLLPTLLNLLLYVCTEDVDTEVAAPRRQGRAARRKGDSGNDPRIIKLGWRLGPKLHAARRASGEQRGDTVPTGRHQRLHQRRGHFKTIRHGKGWQETKIGWINPYTAGQGHRTADTVLHPVK